MNAQNIPPNVLERGSRFSKDVMQLRIFQSRETVFIVAPQNSTFKTIYSYRKQTARAWISTQDDMEGSNTERATIACGNQVLKWTATTTVVNNPDNLVNPC